MADALLDNQSTYRYQIAARCCDPASIADRYVRPEASVRFSQDNQESRLERRDNWPSTRAQRVAQLEVRRGHHSVERVTLAHFSSQPIVLCSAPNLDCATLINWRCIGCAQTSRCMVRGAVLCCAVLCCTVANAKCIGQHKRCATTWTAKDRYRLWNCLTEVVPPGPSSWLLLRRRGGWPVVRSGEMRCEMHSSVGLDFEAPTPVPHGRISFSRLALS